MPQMSPLWWFYLMLTFWLSWLIISMSFFYWFNLSTLMSINPLSFFFFFFYYGKDDLSFINMSNIGVNSVMSPNLLCFLYFYDL